jgi:hypothetical protein
MIFVMKFFFSGDLFRAASYRLMLVLNKYAMHYSILSVCVILRPSAFTEMLNVVMLSVVAPNYLRQRRGATSVELPLRSVIKHFFFVTDCRVK